MKDDQKYHLHADSYKFNNEQYKEAVAYKHLDADIWDFYFDFLSQEPYLLPIRAFPYAAALMHSSITKATKFTSFFIRIISLMYGVDYTLYFLCFFSKFAIYSWQRKQ